MDPYEFNTYKDRFDAVWRRVMSGGTEDAQRPGAKPKAHDPSAAEAGRLRSFMDDEATDAQIYGLLARKFAAERVRRFYASLPKNDVT